MPKKQLPAIHYYAFVSNPQNLSEEQLNQSAQRYAEDWSRTDFWGGYHGSLYNVMTFGTVKSGGWEFNLRPVLKRWLVKDLNDGSIRQYYAPTKTALRKTGYFHSQSKIIESPEGF